MTRIYFWRSHPHALRSRAERRSCKAALPGCGTRAGDLARARVASASPRAASAACRGLINVTACASRTASVFRLRSALRVLSPPLESSRCGHLWSARYHARTHQDGVHRIVTLVLLQPRDARCRLVACSWPTPETPGVALQMKAVLHRASRAHSGTNAGLRRPTGGASGRRADRKSPRGTDRLVIATGRVVDGSLVKGSAHCPAATSPIIR